MLKKPSKKRQKWRKKLIKKMLANGGYKDNMIFVATLIEKYIFEQEKPNTITQK